MTALYLRTSAREACDTFHAEPGQIWFGADHVEIVLEGDPTELRKLADKILAAADRHDALASVLDVANRAGVPAERSLGLVKP